MAGYPRSDQPLLPLTRLAAAVISDLIGPDVLIGIAWGSTLAAIVEELRPRTSPGLKVVQLAGSSGRVERIRNPGELARTLAERLGGTYHALFAPAFVEWATLRDALLREPEIRTRSASSIVSAWPSSASAPSPAARRRAHRWSIPTCFPIRTWSDCCWRAPSAIILYPFDSDGRFVADRLADRAVAVTTEQLVRFPRVIAVAGGANKAAAIAGALSTGIVSILVIDEPAARRLVVMRGSTMGHRRSLPGAPRRSVGRAG